jgi:hypothetical protein
VALCPFAVHKLIPPGANDPKIRATTAILHVDAGGASSLFEFFRDRSGGIESHFHIKWDGTIEQYRDTDYEADANYKANPFAISIETQGFGNGWWNKRQLRSIKRLLLWLNATHDIPLVLAGPTGPGVGFHTMHSTWSPVAKSCPGPNRIKQFNEELYPWMVSLRRTRGPEVDAALEALAKAKGRGARRAAIEAAHTALLSIREWVRK